MVLKFPVMGLLRLTSMLHCFGHIQRLTQIQTQKASRMMPTVRMRWENPQMYRLPPAQARRSSVAKSLERGMSL